ncbi:hypothetical protein GCK72_006660 [Caenorhabditis remanei]|uniref:MATH domain-containing protein n=1 Tax=Caenorhabditis remanei TaxID=31234 RepID=A0A6A5HLE9_CAERE|nr:hypothetical protein GCK72_006660 [Caenorhabditis remanei]KAF1766702.1 hypothetical protein GCK72_006660 [Caenorhabditis remanei]
MEGQCEGTQKKKASSRTRIGCDVGCQTEQTSSASISYVQQHNQSSQPSSNATSQQTAGGGSSNCPVDTTSSSASASGASTPANQAPPSSPAPSSNQTSQTPIDKKLAGPAGVKPNEIEAYFGEKQPVTGTATNTQAPPGQTLSASQQSKSRAASTTGVVGEVKKQNGNANASSSNAATNGNAKSDGPSWSDDNCKLRLVINRFSQLEETMCSPPKSIEGVSWKIMVMPKQHMVQKKQQKCMGFFLQCAPERAYSDQWSVHAIADMRMISYKPNVPHFARRTTHTYTSKENDWGYSCFMTWADIIDEGQGYIRDDTVVLEIAVKAEAPKNMMTHEDFLDKIEKWIVLADMQMKKGNIDLALEANQSAMKFCKGKDDECYQRLETQRETFVNAKLFESIERIEKGPVVCTDTTHGKPTSLRQALTGAQKSLNGKMTAKGGKKTRAVVTVQHMKKKKPYDQNNPNQRNNTGPTVKDLVEKRKSSKSDDKKDSMKTKEELDADEQTESDESPDEKAINSDEEEEIEFDDEEYNEGDYCSQADECSTLELFENLQDIVEEENEDQQWENDDDDDKDNADQGQNEDGILVCDRMVQTDFEEVLKNSVEDIEDRDMVINEEDQDVGKEEVETKKYYDQTGVNAKPEDTVETVFGGDHAGGADAFSNDVLDSLPTAIPVPTPEEEPSQLQYTEKFLKSWLDLEGALSGNVDPEGVFARLSEEDRQDLLDELNFKINPLIVALDHEFRETVSCANNCLESARGALYHSQKVIGDCDKMKETFEERLTSGFSGVYKEQQKRPVETTTKKTTSAAATSGSSAKSMTNGRPTVIAKRSMKQVVLDPDSEEARNRAAEYLRTVENVNNVVQGDEHTQRMRDALEGFKDLHRKLQPMMATITSNNERFLRIMQLICSDNGVVADYVKKLMATHNNNQADMSNELKQAREAIATAYDERKANEKKFQDNITRTAEEIEKSARASKEIKELQNKLKKSESKEKKEETRANLLQISLNELEEKSKVMRKELETLKKKSTEERAKAKKEKDRDSQTIRQQSIEITERETERDKARKELEEALRQKEKFEKDKKAVAGQLVSMTERARTAEIAVMESKWNVASEELKKRREAIHHGFTETEILANRTRQVSDRDIMRKSLGEWKAALDKIDAQIKSVKSDYDHASDLIKNGVKTLSQTLDIKIPAADTLPNLVKPPPVQVVAPSPSVIPAPIMPPTPAAGVIGQPRTPIGASRQGPSAAVDSANAQATPPRSHVQRVPSPVGLKASRTEENPSSVWSWNTIGTIGNLGELREPSRSETNFNSSMDSLQRDIWAANGNTNGSLGHDFLMRPPSSALSNGMASGGGPPTAPFLRSQSSQPQPSVGMNQASYQQSQLQQHQHHQNSQRMQQQQQQPRGYGDMWNAQSMQQNSGSQDYGNQARMMANHNGGGDMSNNQGYSPWHNPPSQQQLRGPTPQQQSAGGHHNMFQTHFFDNGM